MIKQDTLMTSKAQKRLWMSFLVKEMQGVKKKKKTNQTQFRDNVEQPELSCIFIHC